MPTFCVLDERELTSFNPRGDTEELNENRSPKHKSVRAMFGKDEDVYIMDAKSTGNIGRFLNVSKSFSF